MKHALAPKERLILELLQDGERYGLELVDASGGALKRGTVCERCLRDNPDKSKFCADCGAALPGGEAES